MSFYIVQNDISKMDTDAIVNAANEDLIAGSGVCGAIFYGAADERLQSDCFKIGHCNTGSAVLTNGYNLKAKYIIHAVGPIWRGGNYHEEELLRSAYRTSLKIAKEYDCKSISLPLISSGVYGYPKDQVLKIVLSEIEAFLLENDMEIYLVVYDKRSFKISSKLFGNIKSYIDDNFLIDDTRELYKGNYICEPKCINFKQENLCLSSVNRASSKEENLINVVNKLDETFSQMLLRLIDEKGKTDVEVYKKANIDRKLFSKIRSNPEYNPKKTTAISLAIALELNLEETNDLLSTAGYVLSHSSKFDIIIEYFISMRNYNIYDINEALFSFDQMILGA